MNTFAYNRTRLYKSVYGVKGRLGKVGLPMRLCAGETLPLWAGFFEYIGFEVVLSEPEQGDFSFGNALSDELCKPALDVLRQTDGLLSDGADFVFMPCENFSSIGCAKSDECSIAAFFPEILRVCCDKINDSNFIAPYLSLEKRRDAVRPLYAAFRKYGISKKQIINGLEEGYSRLESYKNDLKINFEESLFYAGKENLIPLIIAGRDSLFSVETDTFVSRCNLKGYAPVSSDGFYGSGKGCSLGSNSYTFKLFKACEFALRRENMKFIQLSVPKCKPDRYLSEQISCIFKTYNKPYGCFTVNSLDELIKQ